MQRTSHYRVGNQRCGNGRVSARRIFAWLAAVAIGPVFLGCTSANQWTANLWGGERIVAEEVADPSAAVATRAPVDDPAAAAEDPQLTEAFVRLEQAQAEMRRRQSEAAASIAQANRSGSPDAADPPAGTQPASKVR